MSRPPLSPTGERRWPVYWSIAPAAAERVRLAAAALGISASQLVEEWALSLHVRRVLDPHSGPPEG